MTTQDLANDIASDAAATENVPQFAIATIVAVIELIYYSYVLYKKCTAAPSPTDAIDKIRNAGLWTKFKLWRLTRKLGTMPVSGWTLVNSMVKVAGGLSPGKAEVVYAELEKRHVAGVVN